MQQLNLNWKWSPIYWQTANLIVDSGSGDEDSNEGTNYGKMGIATSRIQKEGVVITNPNINTAEFGFVPNEEQNSIMFSLKGINAINTDLAQEIIRNRPYSSFEDFCTRMIETGKVKNAQVIMLIKAGCFLNLDSQDRSETMRKYLTKYQFKPVEKLTLAQMNSIQEYNIIPEDLQICVRYLNYKKYVLADEGFLEYYIDETKKLPKAGYHDRYYILDANSQPFFIEHFTEESVMRVEGEYYIVSEKRFTKEVDAKLQPLKDWFVSDTALKAYNEASFSAIWSKYASGNEAKWSMQALTYYDQKHELADVDNEQYGIVDFYSLDEEPEPYDYYTRWIDSEQKLMPKYKIDRISGTVLNADNQHHTVSILTTTGVVDVKFYKEAYAFYSRKLSQPDGKGGKTVVEDSWFKRGTLLIICGFRRGDQFVPRNYGETIYKHTVNRILDVRDDGSLNIQFERTRI